MRGGCYVPLSGVGAASPLNTMWLGPRPTSVPSDLLIHQTVWPQYTNVTDRQTDRKDKLVGFYGPIAPPVPNAPSSECPRASIAARRRAAGLIKRLVTLSTYRRYTNNCIYLSIYLIRISRRASCCCSTAIAGIALGANFKIYLLHQFCSN